MDDKTDPMAESSTPWVVEGVSADAIAKAESEAARRGLTLGEWVAEVIERALIEERAAGGGTDGA